MRPKNIRKLLEQSAILMAQAQMLHEELVEYADAEQMVRSVPVVSYHKDVTKLTQKIREKTA